MSDNSPSEPLFPKDIEIEILGLERQTHPQVIPDAQSRLNDLYSHYEKTATRGQLSPRFAACLGVVVGGATGLISSGDLRFGPIASTFGGAVMYRYTKKFNSERMQKSNDRLNRIGHAIRTLNDRQQD